MLCHLEKAFELLFVIMSPIGSSKRRRLFFNFVFYLTLIVNFVVGLTFETEKTSEIFSKNHVFRYTACLIYAMYVIASTASIFFVYSRFRNHSTISKSKRNSFIFLRSFQTLLNLMSISYFFVLAIVVTFFKEIPQEDLSYNFNIGLVLFLFSSVSLFLVLPEEVKVFNCFNSSKKIKKRKRLTMEETRARKNLRNFQKADIYQSLNIEFLNCLFHGLFYKYTSDFSMMEIAKYGFKQ